MVQKTTKQGVRDLNHLPSKKPVRLPEPPKVVRDAFCRHPHSEIREYASGDSYCRLCGQVWDWNGEPY